MLPGGRTQPPVNAAHKKSPRERAFLRKENYSSSWGGFQSLRRREKKLTA
jgi:hypothetical protein